VDRRKGEEKVELKGKHEVNINEPNEHRTVTPNREQSSVRLIKMVRDYDICVQATGHSLGFLSMAQSELVYDIVT